MDNVLDFIQNDSLSTKQFFEQISQCNDYSVQYGLSLSVEDIQDLLSCRMEALHDSGRIEFGNSILPKLIEAFCDSPFITQSNYVEILSDLQEAFYYYKGESMDAFSDEELIEYMKKIFNGRAQGSSEYLINTSLDSLCRYAKNDCDNYDIDEVGDLF